MTMNGLQQKAALNLENIRKQRPLIHTITNPVVMNFSANALLATGASPVMAYSPEEVEEMVAHAAALVLNLGTPTADTKIAMLKAGKKAQALGLPILLDPVGCGATQFRTQIAAQIIEDVHISVIRGNPSEILSLNDSHAKPKGVYTVHSVEDAEASGKQFAETRGMTVAMTGTVDVITDGARVARVANGHPLMGYVTGVGCTASAIIGAFLSVDDDPLSAAATALAFCGLAGEAAGKKSAAPGAFMIEMVNALYTIQPEDLEKGCKIES
jgi:hydroxyethylthiazole kinase